MASGIYSVLAGAKLKEQELEIVAHNLSNATTTGYKEHRVSFASVLEGAGEGSGGNLQTKMTRTVDFRPGAIQATGDDLDLALLGNGFFEIRTDQGTFYTRNGAFSLNASGELVTLHQGEQVMGVDGPMVPGGEGRLEVSSSGNVTVDGEEKGRIKVVSFDDVQKLTPVGATFFSAPAEAAPVPDSSTQILQGKLEGSNTSVVVGLTRLIEISRQHQAYQKVIAAQSKMDQVSASSIGSIT